MLMTMTTFAIAFMFVVTDISVTFVALLIALVRDFLITVRIMMMTMTSSLLRRLLGDDHLLIGRGAGVAACLRFGRRVDRRDETVGPSLRNDHVDFGVTWRHDPKTLLSESMPLEHAVRASAAVGASLELREVVGKLQSREATTLRNVSVVVLHVVYRRHHTICRASDVTSHLYSISTTTRRSANAVSFGNFSVQCVVR